MADFCKACSIDMFGKDYRELATPVAPGEPDVICSTLCEGCGPILVNRDGECLSTDCLCRGQAGHGVRHPAFIDKNGNATRTPPVEMEFGPAADGSPSMTCVPQEGPLAPLDPDEDTL
mgnify:CR=1 FL=1